MATSKRTKAKAPPAKKVAKATGRGAAARARRPDAAADDEICNALRSRAAELRQLDANCQQAARIVDWAATSDGAQLRRWMVKFMAEQAAAPTWGQVSEQAVERMLARKGVTQAQFDEALERAQKKWDSEVVSDGHGLPLEIDVVEYIDRLAYWIAVTPGTPAWLKSGIKRRNAHLNTIETKALELAKLLAVDDGPIWPPAIELFDSRCRPVLGDAASLREYRARVSDRLKGQQLQQLLRNLAERSRLQARMDGRALAGLPRPNSDGALERLLARQIRAWFETQCRRGTGDGIYTLIADLINANRSRAERSANEDVTEDRVKDWLRPLRIRTAKQPRAK